MNKELREYLAKIGAKGGKAGRRVLTREQSMAMVEAKRAKARKHKK